MLSLFLAVLVSAYWVPEWREGRRQWMPNLTKSKFRARNFNAIAGLNLYMKTIQKAAPQFWVISKVVYVNWGLIIAPKPFSSVPMHKQNSEVTYIMRHSYSNGLWVVHAVSKPSSLRKYEVQGAMTSEHSVEQAYSTTVDSQWKWGHAGRGLSMLG